MSNCSMINVTCCAHYLEPKTVGLFLLDLINTCNSAKMYSFSNLPLVTLGTAGIQLNRLFSFNLSCKWNTLYLRIYCSQVPRMKQPDIL